ncbi:sigma-54-dependent transcriptional regulator [Halopseudomonas formosensis]|jgi:two-component system response regulator FlrC|uniref:Sigma-54 dependent transcriptional regulator n=1 Tax=Halopseudomonas formosensis TaxID=1002526 RepID=A0A1I6C916_9GAMM|nr:sigma-54 dependent transcriptional regulator [Halopseudomonas formosensis]MDX9687275.1 sigma-54 dependent transcriptional regulator [Halopseudomonas formosensis]MDY3197720.1 sigma-54 dependent transcriptional regulator [Pseudomonadaceae bacterium]NLC00931.1 sigma-54-dependent Fis family transcriptional regulator [Halopseudomonas formosensis]SFQ89634.1 two-component system, response regulator FlrC [Halopseudomonas formosensis]
MSKSRILLVEDDRALREALADTLALGGYDYLEAADGEAALTLLQRESVAMVVSDVNMPGMDGHALLRTLRERFPQLPVLLMTAYGTVQNAVVAMRDGAVDYLVKPFEPQALLDLVAQHALGRLRAGTDGPVAVDPASQQLLYLAQRVAASDSTVLISGESGTGKEVLARYIHQHSPRADQPFIAINCAAIPENMLEATLFGHEKGAFTGAVAAQPGKFEQANGGTLLLDEISEMPLALQAKLLRVLQEREVERVGGRRLIELDIRILATTNRDMQAEVAAGRFREDLYYRLGVFPLQWTPLRERPGDILPIAERLLARHAGKMNQGPVRLAEDACQALRQHNWPGNVRELDNAIQRALILQQGGVIRAADLCLGPMPGLGLTANSISMAAPVQPAVNMPPPVSTGALGQDVKQREFQLIIDVLRAERGRRKEAAERLGISPRTLRYKLAQMRDAGVDVDAMLFAG